MVVFRERNWSITIIISFLALTLLTTPAFAASLNTKRNQLNGVQSKIQQNRSEQRAVEQRKAQLLTLIEANDRKIGELQREINSLQAELEKTTARRRSTEAKLKATIARLEKTKAEFEKAKRRLAERREAYNKRLVNVYKTRGTRFVTVLLNSKNINDFVKRSAMVVRVAEGDARLVAEIQRLTEQIAAQVAQIEVEKKAIETQRAQLVAEENRIKTVSGQVVAKHDAFKRTLSEQQAIFAKVEREQIKLAQAEDVLVASSSMLASEIRELERRQAAARSKEPSAGSGGDSVASPAPRSSASSGASAAGMASPPAPARKASSSGFIRPCSGYITSNYGWRYHPILKYNRKHTGTDFGGLGYGSPIYAAQSGTVLLAGSKGGYGNTVIISHGGGISTLYGHNSQLLVKEGARVERGETIALSGSSGLATGPHLHFEVRVNGSPKNPMNWID